MKNFLQIFCAILIPLTAALATDDTKELAASHHLPQMVKVVIKPLPADVATSTVSVSLTISPTTIELKGVDEKAERKYTGLAPEQRPEELKALIDGTFKKVSGSKSGGWIYYGKSKYGLMRRDDHALIDDRISRIPTTKKEYNIMDRGAGRHTWADALVKHINAQTGLPEGLRVNILSLTGEDLGANTKEEIGICTIYKCSKFHLEWLDKGLTDSGLAAFNGKIDLNVARYTDIHLHDAPGALVAGFNSLRPGGLFLTNGFPIFYKGESPEGKYDRPDFQTATCQLLTSMDVPFVLDTFIERDETTCRGVYSFMVQRPDAKPCNLPLGYGGVIDTWVNDGVRGGLPLFTKKFSDAKPTREFMSKFYFYGDSSLTSWLTSVPIARFY